MNIRDIGFENWLDGQAVKEPPEPTGPETREVQCPICGETFEVTCGDEWFVVCGDCLDWAVHDRDLMNRYWDECGFREDGACDEWPEVDRINTANDNIELFTDFLKRSGVER